jgi:hypothetical protein
MMNILKRSFIIGLCALFGATLFAAATYASPQAIEPALPAPSSSLIQPEYAAWLIEQAAHVAGTPTTSAQARQSVAAWTILVYMAADNDLEGFGLADLNEMEFVGSTEGVNIVAQIDRAEQHDASNGNWTDTRRYLVTRDNRLTEIASEEIAQIGEINTGDPASLVDFAMWGIATYPAERYALIIWDHGGSWLGLANDNSADGNSLTLPELRDALAQIVDSSGIGQFELIGFDACLMGSFEVYRTIAPYARYAVGSAELIPGNGWDYFGTLEALAADPTLDGEALGRSAVDNFMIFYTEVVTQYKLFNLGLIDLGKTDVVVEALDQLNSVVNAAPASALTSLVLARSQTPLYGAFNDPRFVDEWAAADLLEFLHLLSQSGQNNQLAGAAQNAYLAGASMVLYYRSSADPNGSDPSGVSIYFPRNARLFQSATFAQQYNQTVPPDVAERWFGFLTTFFRTARDESDSAALSSQVTGVSADATSATMTLNRGEFQPTKSTLLVTLNAGSQPIMVYYSPVAPDSTATANWPGRVAWLSNGLSEVPVLVLRDPRSPDMGVVNGWLYPRSGASVEAQLVFDLTTDQLVGVWGLRRTADNLLPFEIAPQPGDLFVPAWITATPGGALKTIPAHPQLAFGDTPFSIVWKRAPAGAYNVAAQVENAAGQTAIGAQPMAVTANTDTALTLDVLDPDDPDWDGDGVPNDQDGCPTLAASGDDADSDGVDDLCDLYNDTDTDGDGVPNADDDCPYLYDPEQDGLCDLLADADGDGIPDDIDLCPDTFDGIQADADWDGVGDTCDPEDDYADDDYGDYADYGNYADYSDDDDDYADGGDDANGAGDPPLDDSDGGDDYSS